MVDDSMVPCRGLPRVAMSVPLSPDVRCGDALPATYGAAAPRQKSSCCLLYLETDSQVVGATRQTARTSASTGRSGIWEMGTQYE